MRTISSTLIWTPRTNASLRDCFQTEILKEAFYKRRVFIYWFFNIGAMVESDFQRLCTACANYEISVWRRSSTRVILQSFKCNEQELSLKWTLAREKFNIYQHYYSSAYQLGTNDFWRVEDIIVKIMKTLIGFHCLASVQQRLPRPSIHFITCVQSWQATEQYIPQFSLCVIAALSSCCPSLHGSSSLEYNLRYCSPTQRRNIDINPISYYAKT